MDISKVGVAGAGLMGHGIAQVSAQAGYDVVLREVDQERLDKGIGRIQKQLSRAVEKEKMTQVEVVQTVTTDDESLKTGFEFGEKLGKLTVHAKDKTGFIVNRLLVPYLLDAIRAYEEGTGSIEEIDAAMKAGAAHPMGPFTLLDFVGLDTTKSIADIMFDEYRERRFAAPPTLRKMVAAGYYGRKSGKGFYDYSGEEPVPTELGL